MVRCAKSRALILTRYKQPYMALGNTVRGHLFPDCGEETPSSVVFFHPLPNRLPNFTIHCYDAGMIDRSLFTKAELHLSAEFKNARQRWSRLEYADLCGVLLYCIQLASIASFSDGRRNVYFSRRQPFLTVAEAYISPSWQVLVIIRKDGVYAWISPGFTLSC